MNEASWTRGIFLLTKTVYPSLVHLFPVSILWKLDKTFWTHSMCFYSCFKLVTHWVSHILCSIFKYMTSVPSLVNKLYLKMGHTIWDTWYLKLRCWCIAWDNQYNIIYVQETVLTLFSDLLYKNWQDFMDIQYIYIYLYTLRTMSLAHTVCPGSSDPFYVVSKLYKMGHYFLDTQYIWLEAEQCFQSVLDISH